MDAIPKAVLRSIPSEGMIYRFFYTNETGKEEREIPEASIYPSPSNDQIRVAQDKADFQSF